MAQLARAESGVLQQTSFKAEAFGTSPSRCSTTEFTDYPGDGRSRGGSGRSRADSEDDHAVARGGRSRPRVDTETLEENDELHTKLRELDEENRMLRQTVQDLESQSFGQSEQIRQLQEDLARQQASGGASFLRVGSRTSLGRPKRLSYKSGDDLKELLEDYEAVYTQFEELQDQMDHLHGALEAAEKANQDLQREREHLQHELDRSQHRHGQDAQVIQRLEETMHEMQGTLDSERQKNRDSQDSHHMGHPPMLLRKGTLADELELAPEPSLPQAAAAPAPEPRKVPPRLQGHLQKKSPSALFGFRPYQRRFIVVENGKVSWWSCQSHYPDQAKCCGSVDLLINPCMLELDGRERDKLSLRPLEQVVVSGVASNEEANGGYTRAEVRKDPSIRFRRDGSEEGMVIFWLGRWYIGPDTCISHALASREGPDTLSGLIAGGAWSSHQASEQGRVEVLLAGAWVAGSFTGAQAGRILEFSVRDSEVPRERWAEVLQEHLEAGRVHRRLVAEALAPPAPPAPAILPNVLPSLREGDSFAGESYCASFG